MNQHTLCLLASFSALALASLSPGWITYDQVVPLFLTLRYLSVW